MDEGGFYIEDSALGFTSLDGLFNFLDNLLITDLWAVDAKGKLAATWAKIKDQ